MRATGLAFVGLHDFVWSVHHPQSMPEQNAGEMIADF